MSTIKHTIISWDCSFRNFFHLIDGILDQDYDLSQVEIIYVEQKTREFADAYNHKIGLRSLGDRLDKWDTEAPALKVFYLNEDESDLYHLGRAVNKGLSEASGSIVSVMDGDLLMPRDFLCRLDSFFEEGGRVANVFRVSATGPVGVSVENWTNGTIDYDACFSVCKSKNEPVPTTHINKGPMISARVEDWKSINGYDTHRIWSTGLSRLGQDVDSRLCLATNTKSMCLPDVRAVHPYHPTGFSRKTLDSRRILSLQEDLISWCVESREVDWEKRMPVCDKLARRNKLLIERLHGATLGRPDKGFFAPNTIFGKSAFVSNLYMQWRRFARQIPAKYRV